MKKHLKRLAAPRTWHILRKEQVWITRPRAGAHAISSGLPLMVILRDMLHYGTTASEIKKLLHANEVLVNGKRQQDHRALAGLFDVLTISLLKESYRLTLDQKGRLTVKKIDAQEQSIRIGKITGKTIIANNRVQYHLHNGANILMDKPASIGDTLVLSVLDNTVKEVIPFTKGVHVFLSHGKHAGDKGVLKAITANQIIYTKDGQDIETAKRYVFVIGKEKPVITV